MSKEVQHGTSGARIYHRVTQFYHRVIQFSSGYAILVPGYKFRGCQFEIPGYTRTVGGRRGLSYKVHYPSGDDRCTHISPSLTSILLALA